MSAPATIVLTPTPLAPFEHLLRGIRAGFAAQSAGLDRIEADLVALAAASVANAPRRVDHSDPAPRRSSFLTSFRHRAA